MRALTLWQPMAWAIAEGHKPVENRSWPLPPDMIGARFAVHAGKKYDPEWASMIRSTFGLDVPPKNDIALGAVIAVATFRGCLDDEEVRMLNAEGLAELGMPAEAMDSVTAWFSGPYGFLVADIQRLSTPVPCRGFQGFWNLPEEIVAAVEKLSSDGPRLVPVDAPDAPVVAPASAGPDAYVGGASSARPTPRQLTLVDPVMLERERCASIVSDMADEWRKRRKAVADIVADALEHAAAEINE